jgi:hypothetical protein
MVIFYQSSALTYPSWYEMYLLKLTVKKKNVI